MKIDLSTIDPNQFMVHQHFIGDEEVYLVQCIHIGCEWKLDNLHFRSSIWNKDGELVSASFPKFFNFGEKPHLFPIPENLNGATIVEKLDGSTLIISKYKGQFIIRTRGTIDARNQENGSEIDVLFEKYPKLFEFRSELNTWDFSIIAEWCTPSNQIVIRHSEVDFILIGMINHTNYSLATQEQLDVLAHQLDMKRPATYTFSSVEDLISGITAWKGKEGVVLYRRNGQQLMKIKSASYLFLHRAKSDVASQEKVMDVYLDFFFNSGSEVPPTYMEFFAYLEKIFDFEIATMATSNSSQICDAMKEVMLIIASLKNTVASCAGLSRKQAAYKILQSHGNSGRSSMMFKMLDGKKLEKDDWKKLIFQVLK